MIKAGDRVRIADIHGTIEPHDFSFNKVYEVLEVAGELALLDTTHGSGLYNIIRLQLEDEINEEV